VIWLLLLGVTIDILLVTYGWKERNVIKDFFIEHRGEVVAVAAGVVLAILLLIVVMVYGALDWGSGL